MRASSSRRVSPTSSYSRRGPSGCALSSSATTTATGSERRFEAEAANPAVRAPNSALLSNQSHHSRERLMTKSRLERSHRQTLSRRRALGLAGGAAAFTFWKHEAHGFPAPRQYVDRLTVE